MVKLGFLGYDPVGHQIFLNERGLPYIQGIHVKVILPDGALNLMVDYLAKAYGHRRSELKTDLPELLFDQLEKAVGSRRELDKMSIARERRLG